MGVVEKGEVRNYSFLWIRGNNLVVYGWNLEGGYWVVIFDDIGFSGIWVVIEGGVKMIWKC